MAVRYRLRCSAFLDTTNFGVGTAIAEPSRIKNLGWGKYLNDVNELFVTLDQDDTQLAALRDYEGKHHIQVLRQQDSGPWESVWRGWGAMEVDANYRDAVLTGYGYSSGLWWLHTDWDQAWTSQEVGTIISDLWTRAKTTHTQSNLGFVTTGTIQAPVTTSGGGTPIVLPSYRTYNKRILLAMQELVALSASDTNNGVVFEITDGDTPTFNLWKNLGTDRTDQLWQLGGAVVDFRQIKLPVLHRNEILAVGSPASSAIYRYTTADAGDINDYGRRQESLFLSWVRDETELQRVTNRRRAMAVREDIYLELRFRKGRVIPPGATGASFALADRVRVNINRGITNVDEYRLVSGVQVLYVSGAEHVRALTQQRPGA